MRKPKEYPIPAKELTKFVKSLKQHSRNIDTILQMPASPEKWKKLGHEMNDFDYKCDLFIHFQCGVPLKDLTTENVLNDKFKI